MESRQRSIWSRVIMAGVGAGLLFVLAGDRGHAVPDGIDPLEVLDYQAKPNILFVVDTSTSMTRTPDLPTLTVGGDDPASRFYQAKIAVRSAINANPTAANYGIATFHPATPAATITMGTTGPLVYVSANANADGWRSFFTSTSTTFTTYDNLTPGAANTEFFASLNSQQNNFSTAYNGRFYIKSKLFRNNIRYAYNKAAGTGGFVSATAITCPIPPANLLGSDTTDGNSGTESRACFQLQDTSLPGSPITTYYFTSSAFSSSTGTATCPTASSSGPISNVTPCNTADNGASVIAQMRLELPIQGTGLPQGLTPVATTGTATTSNDFSSATNTPTATGAGIRVNFGTPLADSLDSARAYFASTLLPTRPTALQGRQKNYVILLTATDETDESCVGDPVAAATALYNNAAPVGNPTDRVEVIVVSYTTGSLLATANSIARAGSGNVRDALRATNATDLKNAVANAITLAGAGGVFSASPSVTESVYELSPTVCASCNPNDPDTRYGVGNALRVPVRFEPTFDMPGFTGHLKAYRTTTAAWDAGAKLDSQVLNGPPSLPGTGMTTLELNYDQLTGVVPAIASATAPATPVGRLRRRILTTLSNDYFAPGAALPTQTGTNALSGVQIPTLLWPHSGVGGTPLATLGLDTFLGVGASSTPVLTFAELQSRFGACTNVPAAATDAIAVGCRTPADQLSAARVEARQILLAFNAGAQVSRNADLTVRRNVAGRLLYRARTGILAESTLSTPAVVSVPFPGGVTAHGTEYTAFRDGFRNAGSAINGVVQGYGLTNPDKNASAANRADATLKPVMTVVYYAANDGLHAFRAGPNCNTAAGACGETGGEELWAFVPFDQLGKIASRLTSNGRGNHSYQIAASPRVADVFVPGTALANVGTASLASHTGRWRTFLFLGRGIGGKSMTALDITSTGPYTRLALNTLLPGVAWSRGNPDTRNGLTGGTAVNASDTAAYARMGQTWSVPALARVIPADNPTTRTATGTEWVLYMGSGYGAASEGSTFFTIDALTGDVVRSFDAGDRGGMAFENAIVAGPAAYVQAAMDGDATTASDPVTGTTTRVYFGDIHGRLYKHIVSPVTAPTLFRDLGSDQPIGAAPALLGIANGGSGPRPSVFVETGNDNRVAPPGPGPTFNSTPPFRMYGLADDDSGTAVSLFTADGLDGFINFPNSPPPGFRGTAQPVTSITSSGNGRVFFLGTQFTPPGTTCIPQFDSILFAVGSQTGGAAYNLPSDGDSDARTFRMANQRATGISMADGQLNISQGIVGAGGPPPAPPAAASGVAGVGEGSNDVFVTVQRDQSRVCR